MHRVIAARLHGAIRRLGISRGLSEDHARDLSNVLVETSLYGIDTHGVRLLPVYLRELDGGRANPAPRFHVSGNLPAVGVFDADHALGVVAASAAMREASLRARRFGIGALAVANSNHLGSAGYYARQAARQNQIGLVFTNSDALVAPFGGVTPINGTNPIAMAVPGIGDDEFLLDMATSQVAYSLILSMTLNQKPLSSGWAVDRFGSETLSGEQVGALKPLGGYKGQGLGTMVQILCALLAGMPFDRELTHLYDPPYDEPRRVSHFMIAIEIAAFINVTRFRADAYRTPIT